MFNLISDVQCRDAQTCVTLTNMCECTFIIIIIAMPRVVIDFRKHLAITECIAS